MSLGYTVRPLSAVALARMTGRGTEHSQFKASWSSTQDLLDRELRQLGASNVVMMVDVAESDIRLDGMLRANARPYSPKVALAFDARKKGSLLFSCGRFRQWQDNIRGIALGLEALRRIERYGIVQSTEQYEGWRAVGPGNAPATPVEQRAWDVLANAAGLSIDLARADPKTTHRLARKATHPDSGGSSVAFRAVEEAARILGLLS